MAPAFQQVWKEDAQREQAEAFARTGQRAEYWWEECARLGHEPRCHNLAWHEVVKARTP